MAEPARESAWPADPVGRALYAVTKVLAIFGGLLGCAMAAVVTISVSGRYLLGWPIQGDYDIVGILCGSAVFAFLPYCQLTRGNVVVDFFTNHLRPRGRAALDGLGTLLYLVIAVMFAWRLYYGMLELHDTNQVLAAFNFYRWWTIPFDIFCMAVLIVVIAYTLARDIGRVRTGESV
jgi:TRAP-type C4-dicarboxylate transport system permease small subunit